MPWLKWFCEAGGGAHLTKPGWSKPHTHSNPTNLALFRHKIILYRFNHGGLILLQGVQMAEPPEPPHFNHYACRWLFTFVSDEYVSGGFVASGLQYHADLDVVRLGQHHVSPATLTAADRL